MRVFVAAPLFASLLALATAGLASPAQALDVAGGTLDASATAVSDYRVRGLTRSDENPSLQVRLRYDHESGVYAQGKGAIVDFKSDRDASVETTLGAGYKGMYDGIFYDVGAQYIWYPNADNDNLSYFELGADIGYDFEVFKAELGMHVSPDYMNDSGVSLYYTARAEAPITADIAAHGHIGYLFVQDEGRLIDEDAADWGVGITYDWATYNMQFGLDYTDTSLDSRDCREDCGGKAVVSVSKSW